MKAFTTFEGVAAPLDRANVDTDQIIPKQFLKSIRRTGFGDNLFDAWRYHDEGAPGQTLNERQINHEFVLNFPDYQDAKVLLARDNFGCGSSREHAVWAMLEYGFRVVIAPSFADIFYNNSFKNGLLPIVVDAETMDALFERTPGLSLEVDLASQTLTPHGGQPIAFDIDEHRKQALLQGLDDIGETLVYADDIREFEQRHRQTMPWVFARDGRGYNTAAD